MVSQDLPAVCKRSVASSTADVVVWTRKPRYVFEMWPEDGEADEDDHRCVFDPYAVLGLMPDPRPVHVSLTCPFKKAEIHNAYLELSRRLHPDCRNPRKERRYGLGVVVVAVEGMIVC
jgi:hypothetical protein